MSKDPRTSPAGSTAIADLSYEDARDELVQIVSRIEGGGASLEESMKLWERGESLAAHCKAKLDQAQAQLDGTSTDAGADGGPTPEADGGTADADDGGTADADDGGTADADARREEDTADAGHEVDVAESSDV